MRDLQNIETHMLDTGRFALETHGEEIAARLADFLLKQNRDPREGSCSEETGQVLE